MKGHYRWLSPSKLAPAASGQRPRPFGCATKTTSNSCPSKPVSFAVVNPLIHTICALRSRERWDARSAMSSRFPFVAFIIASFTDRVTKGHGGPASTSIRCRLHLRFGPAHTGMGRLAARQAEARRVRSQRAKTLPQSNPQADDLR
jgi:hypothetical protein